MEATSDHRICKFISINLYCFVIVFPAASSSSYVQRRRRRRRRPGYGDGAGEEVAAMVAFRWVCWDWVSSYATGETRVEEREVTGEKGR
ncbi:S2-RNase [Pyrus ussuriensis x Pyrus communis]|uniref:S2-RNase n=1 Tax=Pyrus ussuriensis x Pyrus communis TaxID=2448454 RepID=A0A5N5FLG5_9ROSA|nr:S2-RNase [Pyrus ussuriensis x Pyrus communis]